MDDILGGAGAAATSAAGGDAARKRLGAMDAGDMAALRDTGFRAYVAELEARKMAELREKILRAMGLTEEDLAEMDAQRRSEIEKLVARRIREMLLAGAALEEETGGEGADGGPGDGLDDDTAARLLAAARGLGAGPAMLQVLEQAQAAETDQAAEADRAADRSPGTDPAAGRNDPA